MTVGYAICLLASVGLLIAYSVMVKHKEFWLTMLFCCVPVVNLGYSLLSMAKTVEFAVFANDVTYLGSVFLSMCMFLTIMRLCGFEIKKKHIITCVSLGVVMFAIVATSGILPWYYKSVELEIVDGSAKLVKEYGVLHSVYLFYLLGYFAAMIGTIIHSIRKNKIAQTKYAVFIAGVVCLNILMWLFERFVSWNYEFLSVTYIGSELLLLLVYWMMQDYVHKNEVPSPVIVEEKAPIIIVDNMTRAEKIKTILASLPEDTVLSTRQMDILERILDYKSRKEIAVELHLSENTVKTHTGMLY
ncbi:MAG: hypothetical protein J6L83_05770, partial [Clostridia bacterium]|nr:hypothetical protein [Clostridia bacterium]